MWQGGLIYDKS